MLNHKTGKSIKWNAFADGFDRMSQRIVTPINKTKVHFWYIEKHSTPLIEPTKYHLIPTYHQYQSKAANMRSELTTRTN